MTRAALVLAVRPMTRPARWSSQTRANAAMTWVFPVPAGATRQLIRRPEVSRPVARLPLGVVQVRARQGRGRGLGADPLRHRQHRHVDQVLLMVPVLGGAEPLLARRPVDARPVLAERQPGDVDDVRRRGDLQDVHALGPARHGLVRQAVEVLLRVDVSGQRREDLAELEYQLRPVQRGIRPPGPRPPPCG